MDAFRKKTRVRYTLISRRLKVGVSAQIILLYIARDFMRFYSQDRYKISIVLLNYSLHKSIRLKNIFYSQ